jgi:hypothetical protein
MPSGTNNPLEYFVALTASLNATDRLQLANNIFLDNIGINNNYPSLSQLQIVINPDTSKIGNFKN